MGAQEASRAAPVPKAIADPGTRAAMVDQGTPWTMADQGTWAAMADWGTQEAMAGPPSSLLRLYNRSPTIPPKSSLAKVGALSGWFVGGVGSWERSGSTDARERTVSSWYGAGSGVDSVSSWNGAGSGVDSLSS